MWRLHVCYCTHELIELGLEVAQAAYESDHRQPGCTSTRSESRISSEKLLFGISLCESLLLLALLS
jgi:hypothetical protein